MMKLLGITIKHLGLSEFSNGATQHIYAMSKLFQSLGWKVVLLYEKEEIPTKHNNYLNLPVITRKQISTLKLPFTCIMFFEWYEKGSWIQAMEQRGVTVIKYQAGNMFEVLLDLFLKNKELTPIQDLQFHSTSSPKRIWLSPHYETRAPVYDVLYNTKTVIAPYLWDPYFINRYISTHDLSVDYKTTLAKHNGALRVAICEPNRDTLKSSLIPLIGACSAVKQDLVSHVGIFDYSNSLQKSVASVLRDMKCFNMKHRAKFRYAGRIPIPKLLTDYPVVLSHQNDCMLNYIYLEVAYLGFPIVHNSPMCKDIGYYYEGENIDQIIDRLKEIKAHHHERIDVYKERAKQHIWNYSIDNPEVKRKFETLIQDAGL